MTHDVCAANDGCQGLLVLICSKQEIQSAVLQFYTVIVEWYQ